jgi:hypothetical protein
MIGSNRPAGRMNAGVWCVVGRRAPGLYPAELHRVVTLSGPLRFGIWADA